MMRPTLLLSLTTAALLGACASSRSNTAGTNACTQRCTDLPALERSTCELDCSRLTASTPPSTAPTPPPTSPPPQPPPQPPQPPPQPLPPQQPSPQPVPPQQPAPQPVPPRPPAPQPVPVGPATTNYSLPPGGGAPVPTAPGGSTQPAGGDRQAIANCESACIRENPSGTDQATCKLNCNAVGTTYAAPPSYYIQGGTPPSDADARAAVIRSSGGVSGSTPSTPPRPPATQPPATPPSPDKAARCASEAQQCNTTCTAQQAPCTLSCDQGKMSSTDRATCKLTCESNVDLCRDDCRIKEGSCRNKP